MVKQKHMFRQRRVFKSTCTFHAQNGPPFLTGLRALARARCLRALALAANRGALSILIGSSWLNAKLRVYLCPPAKSTLRRSTCNRQNVSVENLFLGLLSTNFGRDTPTNAWLHFLSSICQRVLHKELQRVF